MIAAWLIAASLTASQVAAEINAGGPRAAVAALVAGGDWDRAMRAVAAGDRDWIVLTPQLARGADGGAAEDLGIALAKALPVAASDVLAVIDTRRGPVLGVQRVCGVPFADGTMADIPGYVASAAQAVRAAPALAQGKAQAACLKELALAGAQIAARR
jgi:hypothetical protein